MRLYVGVLIVRNKRMHIRRNYFYTASKHKKSVADEMRERVNTSKRFPLYVDDEVGFRVKIRRV